MVFTHFDYVKPVTPTSSKIYFINWSEFWFIYTYKDKQKRKCRDTVCCYIWCVAIRLYSFDPRPKQLKSSAPPELQKTEVRSVHAAAWMGMHTHTYTHCHWLLNDRIRCTLHCTQSTCLVLLHTKLHPLSNPYLRWSVYTTLNRTNWKHTHNSLSQYEVMFWKPIIRTLNLVTRFEMFGKYPQRMKTGMSWFNSQ